MADENKPAFYPRVGRNIAKNFRSAQPPAFIDDPRAMELPFEYGDVLPTRENLELSRRRGERIADLERQKSASTSPLEKLAGGIQAGRFLGSALTQAVNSLPTRVFKGDEAADKFMEDRIYKPEQPLAYEYAGDIGNFLEKLETEYKIPPLLPEAVALQYLTGPATAQAARAAGKGALQAGMAVERGMEPIVKGALERGGLPREMAMAMGANTQANVVKPKGGNWLNRSVEDELKPLRRSTSRIASGGDPAQTLREIRERFTPEAIANLPESAGKEHVLQSIDLLEKDIALNNWVDSNLTNYVKKQMATPEDPVRKLAEQNITHFPIAEDPTFWNRQGESARDQLGGTQMAQSDLAKQWENRSDSMIGRDTAQEFQDMMRQAPGMFDKESDWIKKLPPETDLYKTRGVGRRFNPQDLGFDHILDVLRIDVASGRIRPEQLNKISMEQAVRRTYEFDQEAAKKMREANFKVTEGFPLYKEYPEGYKWIQLAPPKELPKGYSTILDDVTSSYKVVDENGKEAFPRKPNDLGHINVPYFKTPDEAIADALKRDPRLEEALKYEGATMGHCVGGYCDDVRDGNSKIYSLRDAKGEPHVTIETSPSQKQLRKEDLLPYKEAALEEAKRLPNGYTDADVRDIEIRMARENMPDQIVQIKGKQNAKPKDDYIPFVQDFVRSGNWSTVGDFNNTGLISADQIRKAGWDLSGNTQKYFTKQEYDDFLRAEQKRVEGDGMKRGGVAISNNPDTMMLEVNNQMMAGGGAVAKLLRAAPKSKAEIDAIARRMAPQLLGEFVRGDKGTQSVAGKTQKQFAKEKEMVHDIRPTGAERALPREVDIEELKDQVMVGIAGDPTISGKTIYSVNGVPLESPSPQYGGPLYGLEHEGDAFWASGLSAANRVQNVAREASEQYDLPVLGNYVMMGPDSINYAQHYADANLAAINLAKMSRGQIEDFNNLVRQGSKKSGPRPSFPGIENPAEAYLHFSVDPELRKHFNALMQMPTVTQKYNLPSGIDVRHAVTEPDLRDLEIGVTGKSIGRLRPEIKDLNYSEHPTYSHDIPGEFLGSSKYNIPYELSFPDTVKSVRENPKQAPQEFGSFKYVGPRQVIDQQLIDEIKQYQEMIKKYTGKKKGGAVQKAAGGEITGDDLIIEERPL